MKYRFNKISAVFLIFLLLVTNTTKCKAAEYKINFVGDLSNKAVVNSAETYASMVPQNILKAMHNQNIRCRICNSISKESGTILDENSVYGLYVTYYTYEAPGDRFIYLKNDYNGSEALIHEIGHFVDQYQGNLSNADEWRILYEKYGAKVTGYSGTNKMEGFAETFSTTILYPETVKNISEDLYQYMKNVIGTVQ